MDQPGRTVSIIGAPTSAGAYGPGQETAPASFRAHDIEGALVASGRQVVDRGDGPGATWRRDDVNPAAANVGLVAEAASGVADAVAAAIADDHDVLVLGGDCTVELGTIAGAGRDGASVGLAYIDLDADLNTPKTGDGILDWMGVAHILDVEGVVDELAALADRRPMLTDAAVHLFATENITPAERAVIDERGIVVEPLVAVTDDLDAVAGRTQRWASSFDRLLVHVDIDVLDYSKFPIAENTDLRGGLELAQLTELLAVLCGLPNWRALTLCEVNPHHAPDERQSVGRLMEMLGHALGSTT